MSGAGALAVRSVRSRVLAMPFRLRHKKLWTPMLVVGLVCAAKDRVDPSQEDKDGGTALHMAPALQLAFDQSSEAICRVPNA